MTGIDISVIIIFLLIVVIIAFIKSDKISTFHTYAFGTRKTNTFILTMTLVGSYIGIRYAELTLMLASAYGMTLFSSCLGVWIGWIINGLVIAPKLRKFSGYYSLIEVFGVLFNKRVKLLSIIAIVGFSIGLLSTELFVLGLYFQNSIGVNFETSVLVAILIILLYSLRGGFTSVIITDILQVVMFIVGLLMILRYLQIDVSNSIPDFRTIVKEDFLDSIHYSNKNFVIVIASIILTSMPIIDINQFQRISVSESDDNIKKSYIYGAILILGITLLMSYIGYMYGKIAALDSSVDIESSSFLFKLFHMLEVEGFLNNIAVRGIFVISILALAMSSVDSVLNSFSVAIIAELEEQNWFKKNIDTLILVKICTIVVSLIAVGLAIVMYRTDYPIYKLYLSLNHPFMMIVSIPLVLYAFNITLSSYGVFWTMLLGFVATIVQLKIKFGYIGSLIFLNILTVVLIILAIVISYFTPDTKADKFQDK